MGRGRRCHFARRIQFLSNATSLPFRRRAPPSFGETARNFSWRRPAAPRPSVRPSVRWSLLELSKQRRVAVGSGSYFHVRRRRRRRRRRRSSPPLTLQSRDKLEAASASSAASSSSSLANSKARWHDAGRVESRETRLALLTAPMILSVVVEDP